jgi:hypothetical protein
VWLTIGDQHSVTFIVDKMLPSDFQSEEDCGPIVATHTRPASFRRNPSLRSGGKKLAEEG